MSETNAYNNSAASLPTWSSVSKEGAGISRVSATARAHALLIRGGALPLARSRVADPLETDILRADLRSMLQERVTELLGGAAKSAGIEEAIVSILKKASLGAKKLALNGPAGEDLRARVKHLIATGARVVLFIPAGGGKAPNFAKTGHFFLGDVTEDMFLIMLAAIAAAISEIHRPGARVVIMPDAPLHTNDLGFSAAESLLHLRSLEARAIDLGLAAYVTIANTLDLLPTRWVDEVQFQARQTQEALLKGDRDLHQRVVEQVESLRFSINTRDTFSWSPEHHVLVNAAIAGHREGIEVEVLADADEVVRRTWLAAPHYVAVNNSIRSLDIGSVIVKALYGDSNHIRLTVHAKPGEPRPLLTQKSELMRAGLLPMHSVALRFANDRNETRYAGLFYLEALMDEHRAVLDPNSGGLLYFEPAVSMSNTGGQIVDVGARAA